MLLVRSYMFPGFTRFNCERHCGLSPHGMLLHGSVQTAYGDKFTLCVSPPFRATVGGDRLVGCLDCDAQRSVKDEQDVDADSEKTRHR